MVTPVHLRYFVFENISECASSKLVPVTYSEISIDYLLLRVGAFLALLSTTGIFFAKIKFVIDNMQPLWTTITIDFVPQTMKDNFVKCALTYVCCTVKL